MTESQLVEKLATLANVCHNHPSNIDVLSSGERLAVAIILDRVDWLRADGWASLQAAKDYLGSEWTRAALGGRWETPSAQPRSVKGPPRHRVVTRQAIALFQAPTKGMVWAHLSG